MEELDVSQLFRLCLDVCCLHYSGSNFEAHDLSRHSLQSKTSTKHKHWPNINKPNINIGPNQS